MALFPILVAVFVGIGAREVWRSVPDWCKKSIPSIGRSNSEQQQDDDLTSIPVLSLKLQALFEEGAEKLESPLQAAEIQVSALVFLQLMSQIKNQEAKSRDDRYAEAGKAVRDPREALKDLDEAFNFADWAYDEFEEGSSLKQALAEKSFDLMRHDKSALPGAVAHYIALSPERKVVLIGIKGTSNVEDMLTDLCGQATLYELPDGPFINGGQTALHCHEGVLLAAKQLANDLHTFCESLLIPQGYKILLTGHSLGAGVAAVTGMILRSKFPDLQKGRDRLEVLAFASPPIIDHDNSLDCKHFITTIVNNSDIIPRASLSNLVVLVEFLKTVNEKIKAKGIAPKGMKRTIKFLKKIMEGNEGEMIMSVEEIKEGFEAAFDNVELKDPDHMYVAGDVLHMYDLWSKEDYEKVENAEVVEGSDGPPDEPGETIAARTAERLMTSDGTSRALRYIEVDARMMADHLSPSYRTSILTLLGKNVVAEETVEA